MTELNEGECNRCGHPESFHPTRYVCDEYPHPEPLQLCGCAAAQLEERCRQCGHGAKSHKVRTRCSAAVEGERCVCWGYEPRAQGWSVA